MTVAGRTNGSDSQTDGRDEDFTTSSKVLVERINNESANQTSSQENDGVDDADDPFISGHLGRALGAAIGKLAVNVESLRERQVGTVGSGLVPALGCSTNGAETNGVPEHRGTVPLVVALVDQSITLVLLELREHLEALWITGNESCATEQIGTVLHAKASCERLALLVGSTPGEAGQRVVDNVASD